MIMRIVDKHKKQNDRVLRFLDFLRNQGVSIISGGAALAVTILGACKFDPEPVWLTTLCIVGAFAILGNVVAIFRDRSFAKLERVNEIAETAVKQLLEDLGKRVLSSLNLDTNQTRITFYGKLEKGFVPLARYSSNPTYMTPGRKQYPDKQGTIWDAWEHGRAFDSTRKRKKELVRDWHVSKGIPPEIVDNFTMLPTCIAGLRLGNDKPLGVIIIESNDGFAEQLVDPLRDGDIFSPFLPILKTLHPAFSDIAS